LLKLPNNVSGGEVLWEACAPNCRAFGVKHYQEISCGTGKRFAPVLKRHCHNNVKLQHKKL